MPSQASFGHLERLLSKPPYRHLANTPPRSFRATREFGRTGTSLDPTNPESERLIADLYDELLPQFDSPYFHGCCDEVWDLGEGKSAARARRIGKGRLFAGFIRAIHRHAARHGKRLMIWADILKHHPEAIEQVPEDVIMLNWWYRPESREWMHDHSRAIRRSGHELIVCPGVNNWGAFMPRVSWMRENIRNFAAAGLEHGAMGLMNTEWGDGGHFNLLGTALPGFAGGAEHAWAHERADETTIGRRWPLHVLGDRAGKAERVVTQADGSDAWQRGIFTGFGNERDIDFEALETTPRKLLRRQEAFNRRLGRAMDHAATLSRTLLPPEPRDEEDLYPSYAAVEWTLLTTMTLAKGQAVSAHLLRLLGDEAESRKRFRQAADVTASLLPEYRAMWRQRNHESELDWSVRRIRRCINRWRRAARK